VGRIAVCLLPQNLHHHSWRHARYYVLRYTAMRTNDPSLLIMASLAGGPKHGYAITRDVHETTGVTLGPGTLYGAIARLEEHGLIEPLQSDDRRRPYRLTGSGAAELREQLTAQQRLASLGLRRLSAAEARV
jgi:DNA-binding PadR family transcriptional regulator